MAGSAFFFCGTSDPVREMRDGSVLHNAALQTGNYQEMGL